MADLKTMIQQAHLPEKTVTLCLRGDLVARHEELQRDLMDLQKHTTAKLAGESPAAGIAEELQDLEGQMQSATITVLLRAVDRRAWAKLVADHPPRKDNAADKQTGVHLEAFYEAIIRACWVAPEASAEDITELFDKLTSKQYDDLADAAWAINRRDVDVPFSLTASRISQASGGTSKRPPGSGSASNGSRAGSRKK